MGESGTAEEDRLITLRMKMDPLLRWWKARTFFPPICIKLRALSSVNVHWRVYCFFYLIYCRRGVCSFVNYSFGHVFEKTLAIKGPHLINGYVQFIVADNRCKVLKSTVTVKRFAKLIQKIPPKFNLLQKYNWMIYHYKHVLLPHRRGLQLAWNLELLLIVSICWFWFNFYHNSPVTNL